MAPVLMLGGGLGWLELEARRESLRKWGIATATASVATLEYGESKEVTKAQWFGGSLNPSLLPQRPITDEEFAALGRFDGLVELNIVVGVMTDACLAQLEGKSQLRNVYCWKPQITDRGLAHLRGLANLRSLELLRSPNLSDSGLVHLGLLTNLEELTLSGTKIDGSGLGHLAGLGRLRSLVIPMSKLSDEGLCSLAGSAACGGFTSAGASTPTLKTSAPLSTYRADRLGLGSDRITDAGLVELAGLTNLQVLDLSGPQLTEAGLRACL